MNCYPQIFSLKVKKDETKLKIPSETKLHLNKDLIVLGSNIQQVANMFTYKNSVYWIGTKIGEAE